MLSPPSRSQIKRPGNNLWPLRAYSGGHSPEDCRGPEGRRSLRRRGSLAAGSRPSPDRVTAVGRARDSLRRVRGCGLRTCPRGFPQTKGLGYKGWGAFAGVPVVVLGTLPGISFSTGEGLDGGRWQVRIASQRQKFIPKSPKLTYPHQRQVAHTVGISRLKRNVQMGPVVRVDQLQIAMGSTSFQHFCLLNSAGHVANV
jgi:hypothetical protein